MAYERDPASVPLGTLLTGTLFFAACTAACIFGMRAASERDNVLVMVLMGVGLVAGAFMLVVSLMALRNAKRARNS